MGVTPELSGFTPVRVEVTIRLELPAPLLEALTLLLSQVRPVVATGCAPAASTPQVIVPAQAEKRRRGRPRKHPQTFALAPDLLRPVSLSDLQALFANLLNLPGGEMRAANVLSQFRIQSIAEAKSDQFLLLHQLLRASLVSG